ncbi:hypothetical protein [Mesorhizobium sp. KR1-2]|uniref:hypothetical protein n=1 Tax=Mesorhizobium sp. KR1-2 TaxID=3156609 RepID=UPI0032B56F44
MSRLTIFLSRLLGLFFLLVAITMFLQQQNTVETVAMFFRDPPLIMVLGMITLAIGLAIVLAHNVWSGGALPVVVTLLGWLFLIRGIVLLTLPPTEVSALFEMLRFSRFAPFFELIMLIIGAYLTFAGFRASPPPTGTNVSA